MDIDHSFGQWLRLRRRALDLTQEELAGQVGCSAITLRKLEAEERRPSKQIAERLAEILAIPPDERAAFLRFARGDPFAAPSAAAVGRVPVPEPRRHNLPLQLTSFIGREQEVTGVGRMLTGSAIRLLTLVGTGGAGKTRLSQQAALAALPNFADGAWLVELAPLADPALVDSTTAAVLGLAPLPGRTPLAQLLDHLRPKYLLLVLDNCEHLLQACAELAESLLRACPELVILATSREGLGIPGESLYQVGSLTLPDADARPTPETLAGSEAVRLFVERAASRLAGFSLTEANAPAVAQICRQLDGIPLALELAAARINVLPVEQIAARLSDRFHLLTGGSRTALPRHQTLQALIDWSYDLLSEPEARLLRRLAVFAGGWTLGAAEAICGDETGVADKPARIGGDLLLDLLGGLVDKSLVVAERPPDDDMRYGFLETIRQYALAKLAAGGEAEWLRRRHVNYYVELSMSGAYVDPPPPDWGARMSTERDNLRSALAWSQSSPAGAEMGLRLAHAMDVGIPLTNWSEARGWLESALAQADAEGIDNPPIRARILFLLGYGLGTAGEFQAAEARLLQALELFRELGQLHIVPGLLERRGWIARERGDMPTARLRLEESVELFRGRRIPSERTGLAVALNTLGELTVMQGDLARAETLLEEARALARQVRERFVEAWSLNHLGHVAQLRNEPVRAASLHAESLALFEALDYNYGVAEANHANGETALATGNIPLAAIHFARSLELARQSGFQPLIAWNLGGAAGVALLAENPERAARLWGAAEALRQSIGVREAPASHATHHRLIAAAREQVGEAKFAAEWAAGEALTLEQALAEAVVKETDPTGPREAEP